MNRFDLSDEEDMRLHFSILLPSGRSLYEYLCELPLEKLQAYPQKGFHFWMGNIARSPQALDMRDYILYWRSRKQIFRLVYPREYLESLPAKELQFFLNTHLHKVPLWAYEAPLRDAAQILFHATEERT